VYITHTIIGRFCYFEGYEFFNEVPSSDNSIVLKYEIIDNSKNSSPLFSCDISIKLEPGCYFENKLTGEGIVGSYAAEYIPYNRQDIPLKVEKEETSHSDSDDIFQVMEV
jgi:hypothetical protein